MAKHGKPQAEFSGFKPPHITEIEEAAEALKEIRDERMNLGEREEKAQADLVAVMKRHDLKRYPIDEEYEAIVEAKERGFVRKIKRHGGKQEKKEDGEGE